MTVAEQAPAAPGRDTGHRLVFVGGLHRSGTTLLTRCLAAHPQVSGFSGTGAKEDEGQHLQTVYPPANRLGGPGRFARNPRAHLTEDSPLAGPATSAALFEQWRPYWDLSRPVLVEKSPPNLVMGRFLQAAFPGSSFVFVVRHPVVVSLATHKWTRGRSLSGLLENWLAGHRTLRADLPALARARVVEYERLTADPAGVLAELGDWLGLTGPVPHDAVRTDRSERYTRQWQQLSSFTRRRLARRFGSESASFGYELDDLATAHGFR